MKDIIIIIFNINFILIITSILIINKSIYKTNRLMNILRIRYENKFEDLERRISILTEYRKGKRDGKNE